LLNVNAVLFPVTFVAFQTQDVGLFVELSEKLMVTGAVPDVLSVLKLAMGIGSETLMNEIRVDIPDPPLLKAIRIIEKLPFPKTCDGF